MSEVETETVTRAARVRNVDILVGADADQVPLVRSFAADIAMRMDFDLDAIEDLRMAVDEACSLLVRAAAVESRLHCAFEPEAQTLRVRVAVDAVDDRPPSADPLAWQILTALAESLTERVEPAGGGVHRVTVELVARPTVMDAR
ncbi:MULTISPECIES: ATP-binding protein [Actinokineospora]|uniref:Anti-sigma factor n=1 Tax=Actinokineospora fastidiosa TaxID=1816 RepID=A0A918GIL8_9PSEU|nr:MULTISPECIES: ATP-binding protein [Actinokineospora]UVS80968.1 serine-protein kinase RsbW [Actinokineospora sp. UTMC 2448]GGS38603.1 anti-sigma factor [Actinokineospora fastidiosa]